LYRIAKEDKMNQEEKKVSEEKKEWTTPRLTILSVESVTKAFPHSLGTGDGIYS
jgi:hypothetical protein